MKSFKFLILLPSLFLMSCHLFASDPKDGKKNSGEVITLTAQEFKTEIFNYEKNPDEWVYEGTKPAIIDFYADWCGPCKRLAPIMAELAKEYEGKVLIYKIDIDKEKELATYFGIRSIPSLLFIPAKGTPQMAQGLIPKKELAETIDSFLLGSNTGTKK